MFKVGDVVRGVKGYTKINSYIITNTYGTVITIKDLKTSFILTTFDDYLEYDLESTRRLKLKQIKNKLK